MFLTDPTVVTVENSGQFDIPGYTMVFMSANAAGGEDAYKKTWEKLNQRGY